MGKSMKIIDAPCNWYFMWLLLALCDFFHEGEECLPIGHPQFLIDVPDMSPRRAFADIELVLDEPCAPT